MFKIIILIIFLLLIFTVLKGESRGVRFTFSIYFTLLSIVLISGSVYISFKYHLENGPVLETGFQKLFEWVNIFSYLFIVPLFLLIGYKLFKLAHILFNKTWLRIVILVLWLALLIGIGYISIFIFILIFYGFAP